MSQRNKILVVDSDSISVRLVSFTLENEGFEVVKARTGREALRKVREQYTSIILSEAMLPDMDGAVLCTELRADWNTRYTPIVLTTSLGGSEDRIHGLMAGADDFLIRPYDVRELVARLRRLILTYENSGRTHPVTGLPGSHLIERYMSELCLGNSESKWAFLHIDIDNFMGFNRLYGYSAGDDVLRMLGNLLRETLKRRSRDFSFVGHDGADDFVAVVPRQDMETVSRRLIDRFNMQVLEHYTPEHQDSLYQIITDRRGAVLQIPRLRLSIGVVTSDLCQELSYLELREASVAVLRKAKAHEQSRHYVNQRRLVGQHLAQT